MRHKIFLSQGPTMQGTIQRMVIDLGQAFATLGFEPNYLQVELDHSVLAIEKALAGDEVAAVISMNLYSDFFRQLARPCTAMKVPIFFYCFDHPLIGINDYKELIDNFPDILISLTGTDEWDAADRLFGRPNNFTVLRQAVSPSDWIDPAGRDIGGLLIGNNVKLYDRFASPEQLRKFWDEQDPRRAKALNAMVELHSANPFLPLMELVRQAMPPSIASLPTSTALAAEFDFYTRSKIREDAIAVLVDHDVVICGQGWDYLQKPGQKARFMGSTPNSVCLELMNRAKLLFNIVPEYYSCSERVLEAAMAGCPVITTPSRFFMEDFGDSLLYATAPDTLPALMEQAADADAMADRLLRARQIVLERHTWQQRALSIIDTVRGTGLPFAIPQD